MKIENVKLSELNEAKYNPRRLTKKQYEDLRKSLLKYGMVEPIIVNKNNNNIVGGHQRAKIWSLLGNSSIPVYYIELSDKDEKELNIRLNKNSGEWDFDILSNEFQLDDLKGWGFSAQDLGVHNFNDLIEEKEEEEEKKTKTFKVSVIFDTEKERKTGIRQLMDLGYKCH